MPNGKLHPEDTEFHRLERKFPGRTAVADANWEGVHLWEPAQAPPKFWIQAVVHRTQTTADLEITGKHATPGGRVAIYVWWVPGMPQIVYRFADASTTPADEGKFSWDSVGEGWGLVRGTSEDADAEVMVIARDETSGQADVVRVGAEAWIVIA